MFTKNDNIAICLPLNIESSIHLTATESSARIMDSLSRGTFSEQTLTDGSNPFTEKQGMYLSGYERFVRSRNHHYILDYGGEIH